MNKMKKITATAAAMVLSAGIAVGGTLAYLNSVTETKTNTFTSSKNITTTLTETGLRIQVRIIHRVMS